MAREFGIGGKDQTVAALLVFLTDVHSMGLNVAQGLMFSEGFYWDMDDQTRAFSARFAKLHKNYKPTMVQAGVYSSVLHYLKAVESTGAKETEALMAAMKSTPTSDPLFGEGMIREDGRKIHDMYLFEVKSPAESTGPWELAASKSTNQLRSGM